MQHLTSLTPSAPANDASAVQQGFLLWMVWGRQCQRGRPILVFQWGTEVSLGHHTPVPQVSYICRCTSTTLNPAPAKKGTHLIGSRH